MKLFFASLLAIAPTLTFAEDVPLPRPRPTASCVNLTGAYQMPLQKHDRSDDPPVLRIDQDQCRLINVTIGKADFFPVTLDSALDGTEGYFIVGDTIVLKADKGGELSLPTNHGNCTAQTLTFALDADKNMVLSSAKIYNCEDKYKGAYNETLPRLR